MKNNQDLSESLKFWQIIFSLIFLFSGVVIAFLPVFAVGWGLLDAQNNPKELLLIFISLGLPILLFCFSWIIIFFKLLFFNKWSKSYKKYIIIIIFSIIYFSIGLFLMLKN